MIITNITNITIIMIITSITYLTNLICNISLYNPYYFLFLVHSYVYSLEIFYYYFV